MTFEIQDRVLTSSRALAGRPTRRTFVGLMGKVGAAAGLALAGNLISRSVAEAACTCAACGVGGCPCCTSCGPCEGATCTSGCNPTCTGTGGGCNGACYITGWACCLGGYWYVCEDCTCNCTAGNCPCLCQSGPYEAC